MSVKTMQGKVVSNKMNKSAVVLVETVKRHKIYLKMVKSGKKYLVHDPVGVKIGDTVTIVETKPKSCRKKFAIKEK